MLLGVKEATYARYENASSLMTVGRLLHVFEVLNITPEEFFDPLVKERPPQSEGNSQEAEKQADGRNGRPPAEARRNGLEDGA